MDDDDITEKNRRGLERLRRFAQIIGPLKSSMLCIADLNEKNNMTNASEKFMHITELMKDGRDVFIHVQPSETTLLPDYLMNKECVCLQVGHNMPVPINDLMVTLAGISGTLSFGGKPFWCYTGLSTIIAVENSERDRYVTFTGTEPVAMHVRDGKVYREGRNAPSRHLKALPGGKGGIYNGPFKVTQKPSRGHLHLVK